MNRISRQITRVAQRKKKALVAFITAGYPDIKTTERAVRVLEKAGVDMIELGMPFSDPIADGAVIQEASAVALRKGMSVAKFLGLVRRVRRHSDLPLIMMTYYNPLLRYGFDRFSQDAAASGLDGIIVPDMPVEESAGLRQALQRYDLNLILLVSPVTGPQRSQRIAQRSQGFVYYVSLTGVTGTRQTLPADVLTKVRKLKQSISRPVFVGFGISTPQQVQGICRIADGVIIGSAIVKRMGQWQNDARWPGRLGAYVRSLNRMTQVKYHHG